MLVIQFGHLCDDWNMFPVDFLAQFQFSASRWTRTASCHSPHILIAGGSYWLVLTYSLRILKLIALPCFIPTVTTFIVSAIVSHENKLDMVHIQNSTLAGGVAVGSVCNLIIYPYGAIIIGILAGILSVIGYRYLTVKSIITSFCSAHIIKLK